MPSFNMRRDRRSSVSLLFGILALPIIGMIGLAIDYGCWSQTYASLALAANGAALNAVKTTSGAIFSGDPNAQAEGIASGQQWFVSQVGSAANVSHLNLAALAPNDVTVTITTGAVTTAQVSYDSATSGGYVAPIFGRLFGAQRYPLHVTAAATINTAPYVEVVMMLDNSSSMDIGASGTDITNLMENSPCSTYNEFTSTDGKNWYNTINIDDNYSLYQDNVTGGLGGGTYDMGNYTPPLPAYPITIAGTTKPAKAVAFTYADGTGGPYQAGSNVMGPACPTKVNKYTAYAGTPCAFACHFDNNPAHNGNFQDTFGLARQKGYTLRFDLVKNATNTTLQAMASDTLTQLNGGLGNLSVGVYTFATGVTQVYPAGCAPQTPGCEAGYDFTTAQNLVGTPPVLPNTADSGIMPTVAAFANNDNTAFPEDMTALATTYLTPAGNGATPATPRKVLMLVTDGFQDDENLAGGPNERVAIQYSYCDLFKSMGYKVYVVYTPYYPLMHYNYLQSWIPTVEGTGAGSIPYNLQQCSTYENGQYDFVSAANQADLNAALVSFLKQALNATAVFTQ